MEIIYLFLLLCLIIAFGYLINNIRINMQKQEKERELEKMKQMMQIKENLNLDNSNLLSEEATVKPMPYDSPFKCNYTLKWENDPNMFLNKEITVNPFAKSNAEHCRTDSQCKSDKCNDFYCSNK